MNRHICSLLLLINCSMVFMHCFSLPEEARSKGFVYLHEVDPTIQVSLRYATHENFVGRPITGYKNSVVMMTKPTAEALKRVQEALKKDGYSLVIYDAYRPHRASNHFIRWANNVADQIKKTCYYPYVNKADLFKLDYVGRRSGHSRGSTVDLTIIKDGHQLHEVKPEKRLLRDGRTITFLDDGTVDMGASFDLFDKASHFDNDLIDEPHKERRSYLKNIMEQHGFKAVSNEWWHFTLRNELFPRDRDDSYFDFEVE